MMDKISVLNDSRIARIAYDAIKEILEKQKKDILQRLLSETKVGPLDPQVYAKHLGGIAALEELEGSVRKAILKGEKIERELLDAARNNTDSRY
jgi:hypothetical protein